MSIDVRTATDGDDIWDAGTDWRVQDGHLWIVAAGRTIAEYPPGQWTAVWRDETAEQPQDGDNRAGGDLLSGAFGILRDRADAVAQLTTLSAMLNGAWAMNCITRGAISVDVLRELRNILDGVTT